MLIFSFDMKSNQTTVNIFYSYVLYACIYINKISWLLLYFISIFMYSTSTSHIYMQTVIILCTRMYTHVNVVNKLKLKLKNSNSFCTVTLDLV